MQTQIAADEHIIVTGYVSDEQLEQYYAQARVVVIPLRYGTDIKCKTIEPMYHGLPVVSTSMGIEGLPDIENYISGADDAESFAQRVIELYKKTLDWIQTQYTEYIKNTIHMNRQGICLKKYLIENNGSEIKTEERSLDILCI